MRTLWVYRTVEYRVNGHGEVFPDPDSLKAALTSISDFADERNARVSSIAEIPKQKPYGGAGVITYEMVLAVFLVVD